MRGFNFQKCVQILNFFAVKEGGIMNKMKALKLVWLSDRYHLRQYGRTITEDTYYALKNGPVASATRDVLEGQQFIEDIATEYAANFISQVSKYEFKSLKDIDYDVFSQSDIEVIELIYSEYGSYDKFKISEFSHDFPEWKKYESSLIANQSSRYTIDILDFFKPVRNEPLFETDEDVDLAMKIYQANREVLNSY